jgi:pilus assembly protein CpaE
MSSAITSRSVENATRLAIAGVCLDPHTYLSLSQFLVSGMGGSTAVNLNQYIGSEREIARSLELGISRVCIVDLDGNPEEANLLIERLQAEYPDIFIFGASAASDPDQIISAMRNGCTDFLTKPVRHEALEAALHRVEIKQRERSQKKKRGKVISLIGTKGGTGVSSIALHLSLCLAREATGKCLLVDQHPALGDSSFYLGTGRHKYSFYELAGSIDRLDEELLQGFVLHHDSGLDVLDAPDSIDFTAYATPAAIDQTISFLAEAYQYIVIDCPPGLSDSAIATLSQSDQVGIVLTAELPAIRNAVRYIEYLTKVGLKSSDILVVLNRYSKKGPVSDERIEKALQHRIGVRVPNSYQEVIRFINAGTPIEAGQKSDFSSAISSWCRDLIADPANHNAPVGKPSGKMLSFLNR